MRVLSALVFVLEANGHEPSEYVIHKLNSWVVDEQIVDGSRAAEAQTTPLAVSAAALYDAAVPYQFTNDGARVVHHCDDVLHDLFTNRSAYSPINWST